MYTNDLRLNFSRARASTVTRNVRMCICLARFPVCCPASMANTTSSLQRIAVICFFHQIRQTAFCFHNLCQIFSITDSQSSLVISSIFQFRQSIQ